MPKDNPLVSVIVPTYNSAKFLGACLRSVREQRYGNTELVVVDNNSTDNTKEIAREFTDKVFNIGPERSAQRNFGVQQSRGDYVLIVDSDMELPKSLVRSCVEKIKSDAGITTLIIPEESFGIGFWAKCKKLERSFYVGVDWMEAARFFKKSIYLQAGGYDEELVSGEDWDLSRKVERLGGMGRINNFLFHNEGKISLFKTIKKKFYYASEFVKYAEKNKDQDRTKKQKGIISRYKLFLSRPRELFRDPILGLGMLFMKTCEFGLGGIGYLIAKIKNH